MPKIQDITSRPCEGVKGLTVAKPGLLSGRLANLETVAGMLVTSHAQDVV